MSNSATEITKTEGLRAASGRYVADKAYMYVLGKSQPAKLGNVLKAVALEPVTMRVLRHVISEDGRFECVDRRWSASVRYGGIQRPIEQVLRGVLKVAGHPLRVDALAQEFSQVFGRMPEYYQQALPRLLADTEKFFKLENGAYGLADWLLLPTSDKESDVIFDNFLSEDQVDNYTNLCAEVGWDASEPAKGAANVVKKCDEGVPLKILALFAWRALLDEFEPIDFYNAVLEDDRILILSDQKAYPAKAEKNFIGDLVKMAGELASLPVEVEEEEAEGPIVVTETDREEIISAILQKGSASEEELLESVLEVSAGEAAFAGALESLREALKGDDRVMWLGGTRWGKVETFSDEVRLVPASLEVQSLPAFETAEGDVYDQELEEDGFEGVLKSAVYDSLACDVTDEDPARTMYQPNGDSQRCVLKYHHKSEGTFPLCQINPDFFGCEPEIIPITLIDEGMRKTVYVNNAARLIYGLKDFYKNITEVSGAVFFIEKTARPGEYRFKFDGESDDKLCIDTNRSLELLELKARYESAEMPIYDVITEILKRQSLTFPQLVDQENIVKRCSRLLIASILSSYHAFHTRGKSDEWLFDEKKASQGFNKTKRKYIKK